MLRLAWVVWCVVGVSLLTGCSTRSGGGRLARPSGEDAGSADAGVDAGPPAAPLDAGPRPDAGPDLANVLVYAHSRDTLYTFSPRDLRVREVGPFRLEGGEAPFMLDLAVNGDGEVFTTSDEALFLVDPETAAVTEVGTLDLDGEELFALSFLAPGELGSEETLVGATNEGAYYEIDTATASAEYLGRYPDGWRSSGDIVSVEDLGTFATVRRDDLTSDVLVRILFAADGSSSVTVLGPIKDASTDFTQLFGLAYWGRVVYGFSNKGQLIEIDRETGKGEVITADTGAEQFWGAGVTTTVPVLF